MALAETNCERQQFYVTHLPEILDRLQSSHVMLVDEAVKSIEEATVVVRECLDEVGRQPRVVVHFEPGGIQRVVQRIEDDNGTVVVLYCSISQLSFPCSTHSSSA